MTDALARRGPDDHGLEAWGSAVLGHRRLSIFDLTEAGHQPMLSPDRHIGVVFNGAIYNFRELRRELQGVGYCFRSQTDTEVLVNGYSAWGIDNLVRKLRGMFAFAIWDDRRRTLMLVRDRLGVKPLVYSTTRRGIVFASTVEALQAAGLQNATDPVAVLDFLECGWIPDDRSIYENTFKVPPATIMEWHEGKLEQRKYWSVPVTNASGAVSFNEAVEAAETALLDSVRLRLSADVPVAALLSGGIDSSLVCWAVSKLNADVTAFTISTPGESADEAGDACRTARLLGISHELIELPAAGSTAIRNLVTAYGEPFASTSALGMLRASEAARSRATVLLTGDGGDDIFLGYPRHRHMWWAQNAAQMIPNAVAHSWPMARRVLQQVPVLRRSMHFMDYATQGLGAAALNAGELGYYNDRNMRGARLSEMARPPLARSFASARRLLPDFLNYEWTTRFTGEYMTKVDGATMFYGVEARSPFLDHCLWELAATFPYEIRLHRGALKAVLRQIVRNRISADVARRRKRGFTVCVERRLIHEWGQDLSDLSDAPILERDGWIRRGCLKAALTEARVNNKAPTQLWRLLVLEHWMRKSVAFPLARHGCAKPQA